MRDDGVYWRGIPFWVNMIQAQAMHVNDAHGVLLKSVIERTHGFVKGMARLTLFSEKGTCR